MRAAGALGLTPVRQRVGDLPEGLRGLPLFSLGQERAVDNAMLGGDGSFAVFDFEYTKVRRNTRAERAGRYLRTGFVQTVCAVHVAGADIPEFTLAPEGLGDGFLQLFGGDDIDFEEESVFSSKYLLRGLDVAGVSRLFAHGAARFLAEHPGWTVQGKGEWVLYYRDEVTVTGERLEKFLWEVKAVHAAFFPA